MEVSGLWLQPTAEGTQLVVSMQSSLGSAKTLLYEALHPPRRKGSSAPPIRVTHPDPTKPYFDWPSMPMVVPTVNQGRYMPLAVPSQLMHSSPWFLQQQQQQQQDLLGSMHYL
jgi:hypothetical protein